MKRTALVVLLAACQANGVNDYPSRPGGGGPVIIGGGGGGGGGDSDAGADDGGVVDGGVPASGRVCIVRDLRKPTGCDTSKNASGLVVSLGTRHPDRPPARTGEFTIIAPFGTDLVWQVTGANFITTVMPYGTDNTIPVVPDDLYVELLRSNPVIPPAPQEGSVVVRALSGGLSAIGVSATSTLISGNVLPRYDDAADTTGLVWREIGPTQSDGVMWFPAVRVTTTPARVTLRPATGASVNVDVSVVDQAITFVTTELQ